MSTNGFKKLLMVRNNQYQNQKQKKARTRKVNNEEKSNYSTDMEEVNPLLQQIEMLKTKAMEWQEEIRNQDENGKLTEQIAQLEEISRRLEFQVRRLDAADGRMAEQTHQISKKIAYQMGQITDRFDELERELSRDLNESFAEMLEKVDKDDDSVPGSISDELNQVKNEIFEKLDSKLQIQVTPATNENIDQLKADIFGRMDRELLNKVAPATEQKLEEAKAELFARIDRVLATIQSSEEDVKLEELKDEILSKIESLAKEEDTVGIDEKLEILKTEIFEHVHKECVKQYRNIQLLLDEDSVVKDSNVETNDIQKEIKATGRLVKIAVGLGLLNFGILTAYILMQLGVLNV